MVLSRRQLIPRPLEGLIHFIHKNQETQSMWLIWRMWSLIAATRRATMTISVQKPSSRTAKGLSRWRSRKVKKPVADKAVEELKSISQIRIRFSDLTTEENDPFIRYWIRLYGNWGLGDGIEEAEGNDVRVYMDTGANVNTMSRSQLIAFLDANDYVEGPFKGLEEKLVGEQTCTSPMTKLGFRLKSPPRWA